MVREYTKWEHEMRAYQDVDALVDRALVIAMSEPRGPVYLTLPRELLADEDRTEHSPPTAHIMDAAPAAGAIDELADLLAGASQPTIITSTVGVMSRAREVLEEIAEQYAIPVIQSWPYAVNLRSDHPMNLRMQGQEWLAESDVILTIDAAVPWVPRRFRPRGDASILHLGADPAYTMYPYRDFPSTRLIAGSSLEGLRMLARALGERSFDSDAVERRRAAVGDMLEAAARRREAKIEGSRHHSPIHATWIAHCLNDLNDGNAVIVNELGVPFDCLEFHGNEIFIGETTAGGLGSGVGFALGAKLAAPERDVICCVGDGSFMFGNPTPAFLVSEALKAPVLMIVANNGMWYAVEQTTLDIYPDGVASREEVLPLTTFGSSPDYAAIAAACGAYGETVTDPALLADAMRRGIEQHRQGRAALLNVITAPGTR
jgi:acetolactate synthase-1/2/3 large subunit